MTINMIKFGKSLAAFPVFAVFLFIFSFILTGCKADYHASISTNCVSIEEDNTVSAIIVEDFSEGYYSEQELIQMVDEEAASFNNTYGAGSMTVTDHKVENGVISLSIKFKDFDTYNTYMPDSVYIGTIKDVYEQGIDFNRSLWVVGKGESTIGKNDLLKMGNEKVVLVSGAYMVRTPSNVKYYSQGMYIMDANTVMSDSDGLYFVIYK